MLRKWIEEEHCRPGLRRDPISRFIRGFLRLASLGYSVAVRTRSLMYRIGLLRAVRLPCGVISVGNVTAGGTGKTPMVAWLVRRLVERSLRVAVLSRGYGRLPGGRGDDEDFIERGMAGKAIRLTGKDRVASGRRAIADFSPDVILLDDGFQHFRIARDADILMVDATNPFSNGALLPAGLLREPPQAMKRADLIVLTRTDQVSPATLEGIRERIARLSGGKPVVESVHRALRIRNCWNKREHAPEWIRNKRVYAFCGIGNPQSFLRTLEPLGATVVKHRFFPDHYPYTPLDLHQLVAEAREFMADMLITTEKDLRRFDPEGVDFAVASVIVGLEIVKGGEDMDEFVTKLLCDRVTTVEPRKPGTTPCRL
ncbi:MAG: tetraacyldisaccharide 4'-kinase [Planctomycetes bacterium RBG_16_59_8]|nr:MAG: tetraacyldisaccharide 4'-kinase [Planctomycetes bacterium RBG_16_59_8]